MNTERITIRGREFVVTHTAPVEDSLESPYLLTPVNKRGSQSSYRLVRNKPNPSMLFPIGDKPMSPGGCPDWWVKEVSPGVLVPAS